jgi:uroporphyrinogen-III decarboxylase
LYFAFSCCHTKSHKSGEEILEDLKRRIVIGKKWNGFILSTACSIAPQVPKENILLLNEAVNLWGKFT